MGLSSSDFDLLAQAPPLAPGVVAPAFAVAWRNYIKQLFKKGFMFRLSVNLEVTIYISETRPWQAGRTEGMKVRPLVEIWWSAFSRPFQMAWCAEPFAVARH